MSTYIKLEDVQKILSSEIKRLHGSSTLENILEKTNSLSSIDFEEIIHQLKRKNKKSSDYCDDKLAGPVREKLIEEFEELLNLPK